jgi:hypothetical protein
MSSSTTNRDGWVASCIQVMGEDLGSLFGLLCKEFWELNRERDIYRGLFQQNTEILSLLNESGPDFFGLVQILLFDSIALRVARLTDPAISMGNSNLTLDKLGELSGRQDVIDAANKAKVAAAPFRIWRNKVIAHSDLANATQGFPDLFTDQQLEKVALSIEICLEFIGVQYNCVVTTQRGWTDVGRLIRHLRAAKSELERQRNMEPNANGY